MDPKAHRRGRSGAAGWCVRRRRKLRAGGDACCNTERYTGICHLFRVGLLRSPSGSGRSSPLPRLMRGRTRGRSRRSCTSASTPCATTSPRSTKSSASTAGWRCSPTPTSTASPGRRA